MAQRKADGLVEPRLRASGSSRGRFCVLVGMRMVGQDGHDDDGAHGGGPPAGAVSYPPCSRAPLPASGSSRQSGALAPSSPSNI